MKGRLPRRIADALADALLAEGNWTRRGLMARASTTLGEDARWRRDLAEGVLSRFPEPPRDRRRSLARFIAEVPLLTRRERRARVSIRRTIAGELAMGARRWDVPAIATEGALAHWLALSPSELEWFEDGRGLERLGRGERLRHYRYRWIRKRHAGFRLLEAPKARTKALQRQILDEILNRIPAHDAAHGFRRGRSCLTHAGQHVGTSCVVRIDLRDFFLSISAAQVSAVFRAAGYPEDVAWALALLCTNVAPSSRGSVSLDRDASAAEVASLRHAELRARGRHLPQGAPTSPSLANLCAYGLDVRLTALASSFQLRYTRYADDLVFSGGKQLARIATKLEAIVASIASDSGFVVNHRKTNIMRAAGRQRVTGIVVNERVNVARTEFDALKALLHNCALHGPSSQNRGGHHDFRAHLRGRIAHVASLNAARGQKLARVLARVVWSAN